MRYLTKIFTVIMICFFSSNAYSQFTFTKDTHVPEKGTNMKVKIAHNPEFEIGEGGEDVTWEFLGFEADSEAEAGIIDVEDAERPEDYPDADFVVSTKTETAYETYVHVNDDGLHKKGVFSETSFQTILDEYSQTFSFPMSYGDSHEDEFEGTHIDFRAAREYYRQGNLKSEVDGYGTLITPIKEFENVIRVKITREYADMTEKGGDTVRINHDTIYTLFAEDIPYEIASYSTYYEDEELRYKEVIYDAEESIANKRSRASLDSEISIYPNPASKELKIGNLRESGTLTIYNMQGQEIKNTSLKEGNTNHIKVPELENGFYIANIKTDNDQFSEQILVE